MSAGDVGLPLADRHHITAMLIATLDALGDGRDRPDARRAAEAVVDLIVRADRFGRDAALFELAAACCTVIGGPPQIPGVGDGLGPLRYIGHGPDEVSANPGTPAQYAMSHFGTAILAHDRPRAWQIWQPLAPGPSREIREDAADFLAGLIRNAWSATAGGGTRILVTAGERWPPVCDFCCLAEASWMWHCRGGDITVHGGRADTQVRFDDMQFWYACGTCRPLIARPRPAWDEVFARYRRQAPQASRPSIHAMYRAFQTARLTVRPVRLPGTRPAPTPRRI